MGQAGVPQGKCEVILVTELAAWDPGESSCVVILHMTWEPGPFTLFHSSGCTRPVISSVGYQRCC